MQTIKIILGILCVVLCTYLGGQKSSKYKKRLMFWQEIKIINDKMISNQLMGKDSVIKVLNGIDGEISKDFILKVKGDNFSNNYDYIDEKDILMVENYAYGLGKGISDEQSIMYGEFSKVVAEKIKQAELESNKYSSMSIKLGFLIGVAIFIIII